MSFADKVLAFMREVGLRPLRWQEQVVRAEFDRGYRAGVRDTRTLQAAERADEVGGSRQPFPNE